MWKREVRESCSQFSLDLPLMEAKLPKVMSGREGEGKDPAIPFMLKQADFQGRWWCGWGLGSGSIFLELDLERDHLNHNQRHWTACHLCRIPLSAGIQ